MKEFESVDSLNNYEIYTPKSGDEDDDDKPDTQTTSPLPTAFSKPLVRDIDVEIAISAKTFGC